MQRLGWWRLSRKTPETWLKEADRNKSGELDLEELRGVIGSAHGKLDKVFAKLDKDRSGGISVGELTPYLNAEIAGPN